MSKMKWMRPMGRGQVMGLLGMLALNVAVLVPLMAYYQFFAPMTVLYLVCISIITFIGILASRRRWGQVWHSTNTTVKQPLHLFGPRLERALADGNVGFEDIRSRTIAERSLGGHRWDEVYQLDLGGLRLHLTSSPKRTRIFLGPLRGETVPEVERVKSVVAGAAEMGEANG